ncbi:hypothetical protein SKAU_G00208080 [Synaphobranchus kaupii]|uniref:Uncharacterized protein n=1 Tax=Synaphobranchus kaupii TaxID=118154 RepID=A0A9Q1F8V0_SYNKA|nr:hypothetical protein SKAU_G00208080 [Synaphobranchus kaupii]
MQRNPSPATAGCVVAVKNLRWRGSQHSSGTSLPGEEESHFFLRWIAVSEVFSQPTRGIIKELETKTAVGRKPNDAVAEPLSLCQQALLEKRTSFPHQHQRIQGKGEERIQKQTVRCQLAPLRAVISRGKNPRPTRGLTFHP